MRRTSGASMLTTDGEPNGDTRAFAPLGSPSVINMLAPLVRRMFAFAYGENEFM